VRWRRPKEVRWAAIFAEDLLRGCGDLYRVFDDRGDTLTLPITIPIGTDGLVLLQPRGPLDAPRIPATMTVFRGGAGTYGIRLERVDGGPMRFPGVEEEAPLPSLSFTVTPSGLDITSERSPVALDEDTARALAHALVITIGMKIAKAGNR
jgi:hypothetical protein